MKVVISEKEIIAAANDGMDAFVKLFYDAVMHSINGKLDIQHERANYRPNYSHCIYMAKK